MFEEMVVIEKTEKVVVLVVPYTGRRLQHIGGCSYGKVEGLLLVVQQEYEDGCEVLPQELLFPEYEGYTIISTNINSSEIWVTMINLDSVNI